MKRARQPSAGRRPSKKTLVIRIKVPPLTNKQLAELKKLFRTQVLAKLGIAPTFVAQKQAMETMRKRRA